MKITFVNHASFIIEHGDVKLICDPWLEGLAFNNGWKLLSRTQMPYEEFESITHIWFSHEHPDHFSPPNLKKIPQEYRERITVLYQETTDRKVAQFCAKAGFKEQIELKEDVPYSIGEDFTVMCNPYTDGDSYALFTLGDYKILNLNDCIVHNDERAAEIYNRVGKVDLLLTQFAYASRVGNCDQTYLREAACKEKLRRIACQNTHLKPEAIIPFASFVCFCHEENSYLNQGMHRIDSVHTFIQSQLKSECMVMYPGDTWSPGKSWDSTASIQKYLADYDKAQTMVPVTSPSVEESALIENCATLLSKIKKGYPKRQRYLNTIKTRIYITDYEQAYTLSVKNGLTPWDGSYDYCDVALSSDSLNYSFLTLWGGDTLNANGRFQTPRFGDYHNFRILGEIASCLNRKEDFPVPTLFTRVKNKGKSIIAGPRRA